MNIVYQLSEMSQQAYTGHESTDEDYHYALGNVVYNPYAIENPFLYEGYSKFTLAYYLQSHPSGM